MAEEKETRDEFEKRLTDIDDKETQQNALIEIAWQLEILNRNLTPGESASEMADRLWEESHNKEVEKR